MKNLSSLKKARGRPTVKELDKLWADCVKARAGNKCEYFGLCGILHAHHITGKANFRVRWELENGVCLAPGVHKYVAHRQDRAFEFLQWALKKRGVTMEALNIMKWQSGKVDLVGVKLYLEKKLEAYQAKNKKEVEDDANV